MLNKAHDIALIGQFFLPDGFIDQSGKISKSLFLCDILGLDFDFGGFNLKGLFFKFNLGLLNKRRLLLNKGV